MGDYCTRDEVKARLQDISTDFDTLIDTFKAQVSRDIERLTGQVFEKITTTKTFDGSGRSALMLPWRWPVVAITTLKVRTGGEGSTQVTVPSGDYYLEPAGRGQDEPARWIELGAGLSSGVRCFTSGKGTVEITGDFCRSATPSATFLSDINDLAIEMVIQLLRQRGMGPTSLPGSLEGNIDEVPRGLTPRAAALLMAHGWKQAVYLP